MTTLPSSPQTGRLTSLAHSPAFVQPLGSASSPASSSPQPPAPAPARLQEGTQAQLVAVVMCGCGAAWVLLGRPLPPQARPRWAQPCLCPGVAEGTVAQPCGHGASASPLAASSPRSSPGSSRTTHMARARALGLQSHLGLAVPPHCHLPAAARPRGATGLLGAWWRRLNNSLLVTEQAAAPKPCETSSQC